MDDITRLNDAGQKLEDYVEKESASFVIPSDQKYTSSLGNPVSCSLLGENGSCMILNKLAVGDSVTVFFEVTVSADAANVYRLRNLVSVTASYDNNEDVSSQKLIPVNTEEMVDENGNLLTEDEDSVHIPGVPNQNVVKTADRTSGCIITDGILNGTKVPGIYHAEEEVIFSITIKNSGTANLKKILVTDILSEELRNVIDIDTATFRLETVGGFLMTEQGRQIDAKLIDNTHVMLCENTDPVTGEGMLLPDDMVSLEFHCTLKQDVANLYDLENKVMIHSFYYDGQKDQEVAPVEDADMIEVPGIPEAKLAKLADRTTGTVLVEGRYEKRKIPGSYKNLEQVTYLITITNSGTTDLYDLKVRDVMEERLLDAFKKGSVSFQYGSYQTKKEDTIAATKVDAENTGNQFCIRLNRLKAGDSVELCLSGTVNEKAGELSELENKAYVTAHYKKGNEEALKDYEKIVEESGITYALLYHANNGTAETTTDSETPVVAGKKVTVNGNPFYKEGYVFLGWNTREDGSGEDYAPGVTLSMPSQDVHLYAQWDKSGSILKKQYEYSLVYHSNNKKKQEQPDSETRCLAGTILTLDANMFIHEGYRFLGWSLIPNEKDSLLQPDSSYQMPKKDVHLYAQWEKVKTVTLTYHSNYKNDIPGEESLEETRKDFETPCQTGTEITVKQCDFEREDYTFEGWSLRSNAQNGDMKPDQNMILNEDTDLYAVWKPKASGADQFRYKLTYHGNNETMDAYVDSETPCVKGKDILLDSNRFTYDGYEFAGWNTKADGTGKQLENSTSFSMPERNVHLYAIWVKKEKCRLTYQSNYPAASGKNNQEEKTDCETPCLPQTEVTLDGNRFQCDGHAFLGWSLHPDNSNETAGLLLPEETFTLTEDTILYAIWTNQIEEYSLLYSSNTETPIWETDPYSPSPAGTPRKLIQNPFPNKSQSFVGWSLKPDAGDDSKDILHPGDRFEQPNRNVILYAIWKEEEGVTLQYDANGGTIKTSAEQSESDQESGNTTQNNRVQDEETPCVPNDTIRIDANPFAKKGYHFLGWSKKPTVLSKADTSVELIYPGCEYTMPDKNIILYAVWEKNTQHTFDDDPVSESPYTPIAVTELMKDDDRINIPGIPILSVAKMADRTKGIQLKNGRYEGKRKPGTYYKDETVTCKITVSNSGTAAALDLKINEQPSRSWEKVLQPAGYTVSMGENITTAMGKTICVLSKTTNQITLDRLDPGDQVTLYYEAIVKETKVTEKTLKNTVEVSGKSNDGTTIPKTHLMTDSDNIKIGNKDKQPEKNKIISQHPKTGDKTPLVPLSILTIGMFLTAIIIFIINKKKITPNKR